MGQSGWLFDDKPENSHSFGDAIHNPDLHMVGDHAVVMVRFRFANDILAVDYRHFCKASRQASRYIANTTNGDFSLGSGKIERFHREFLSSELKVCLGLRLRT